MKFHNIKMVGPLVNQKLGVLPAFDSNRDQGRMVWLHTTDPNTDGTIWYGGISEWIQFEQKLSDDQLATGLEKISQNSQEGWRLKGQNQSNYIDIGNNAVDISTSIDYNIDNGAGGEYSFAQGYGTVAQNNFQSSFCSYNVGTSVQTILEVGIGIDNNNRLNAFEIYNDGRILAPSLTINSGTDNKSLTTKEYVDVVSVGTGLEKITENSQSGWRLVGKDSNRYGDIGIEAVDLSQSTYTNINPNGATGNYSFAQGFNTIAQNASQCTIGQYNVGTDTNTIFEIGIGTNNTNRSNAIEIYKNGSVLAPSLTVSIIDNSDNSSLVTKNYVSKYLESSEILNYYTKTQSDDRFVNVTGDTMTGNLNMDGHIYMTNSNDIYFSSGSDIIAQDLNTTNYWSIVGEWTGAGSPDNHENIISSRYDTTDTWHVLVGGKSMQRVYTLASDEVVSNVYDSTYDVIGEGDGAHIGVRLTFLSYNHSATFRPKYDYSGTTYGGIYLGDLGHRWRNIYSYDIDIEHHIRLRNLPTSTSGLSQGHLYRSGSDVKIVL